MLGLSADRHSRQGCDVEPHAIVGNGLRTDRPRGFDGGFRVVIAVHEPPAPDRSGS